MDLPEPLDDETMEIWRYWQECSFGDPLTPEQALELNAAYQIESERAHEEFMRERFNIPDDPCDAEFLKEISQP